MEAEAADKTFEVSEVYRELDGLLAATLEVDDYVDLNSLRVTVVHPPFDREDLESPAPVPEVAANPVKPVLLPPPPPKGLQSIFGKKRHQKKVAEAAADFDRALSRWESEIAQTETARKAAAQQHSELEARRLAELAKEKVRYARECTAREESAESQNRAIETLIVNLGYGVVDAVQEYVSVVLSNSVYPDHFPVEHQFEFNATTAELSLRVLIPGPDRIPTIGAYKYKRSANEIVTTALSQKVCKDRYASVVNQVALRSIHEVFEADRRGIIKTISLELGTETINPATGRRAYIPFVAVGAEREAFNKLDLSNVVPAATLAHLGASVSKNPQGLVAADTQGIRRS
jgi:restriction system protein